jgi:hypothetical protein
VARHDTIGIALPTLEGVQVHFEPFITCIQRRNNVRIFGSAASGLLNEDIDIAILSLASQDSQTATLPLVPTGHDSTAQRAAKLVENTSTLWEGRNHAVTCLRTGHSGLSFSPSAV